MSSSEEETKLIFEHSGEEVVLEEGSELQEACEEAGVPFACTEGVCGTCVIEVEESSRQNLSEPTQEEIDFLGDDVAESGEERLACQCQIKKGIVKISF